MNALRPKAASYAPEYFGGVEAAGRIGAKETYFIHMSHHAGLHADIESSCHPMYTFGLRWT